MHFVTFITAEYLPGVFALLESIRQHGCLGERPTWHLVHDEPIQDRTADALNLHACDVRFIPRQELGSLPTPPKQVNRRFVQTFNKLLAFRLPVAGRLCYLDADMLCLGPLSGIADLPHFSAAPDYDIEHARRINGLPMINSGFMVFEPSEVFFTQVVEHFVSRHGEFDFGDQHVTSSYFATHEPKTVNFVDTSWNTLKRVAHNHPERFDLKQTKLLHYVGAKPWQKSLFSQAESPYFDLNCLWWRYYRESAGPSVLSLPVRGPSRLRYYKSRIGRSIRKLLGGDKQSNRE